MGNKKKAKVARENKKVKEKLPTHETISASEVDHLKAEDNSQAGKNTIITSIITGTISALLASVITGGVTFAFTTNIQKARFEERLSAFTADVDTSLERIDASIVRLSSQMQQYQTQLSELMTLKGEFQQFQKNIIDTAVTLSPTAKMINAITVSAGNAEHGTDNIIKLNDGDIIARANDGSRDYTAEEIFNKKILFPYKEAGLEIYFVGQINENLHWDGNCLLNKYDKNNQLIYISEAIYIDGTLLSYKQAFLEKDNVTWCLSQRIVSDKGLEGTSVEYSNVQAVTKKFDFLDVTGKDMLTLSEYEDTYLSLKSMEKYYYGITKNGSYNDASQSAYLITFDDDGYVLTLYKGGFKDGQFDDQSGNAWCITRKTQNPSIDQKYEYYKGPFKSGGRMDKSSDAVERELTYERIQEIISEYYFVPELRWYGFEQS